MAAGRCGSVGKSGEEAINIIKEAYRVFEERLDALLKSPLKCKEDKIDPGHCAAPIVRAQPESVYFFSYFISSTFPRTL